MQLPSGARPDVLVVSQLGAQRYATKTRLAASLDPTVPCLAVLVPPAQASLVQVLLGRALTLTAIGSLAVLTSPELSLAPVTSLWDPPDEAAPGSPEARRP